MAPRGCPSDPCHRARRRPGAPARRGPGLALPLSACSPAGSNAMAPLAARSVASPTRTVPGAAADCSRDAVLTRSPATMPWFVAPERDRSLARQHPGPGGDARTQRAHRVHEIERCPDGSLGIVLTGDRRPPDRHDRVADELLDRAAVALDDVARQVEVARQELPGLLRVATLREGREADEVGEQDRYEAALGGHGGWRREPEPGGRSRTER